MRINVKHCFSAFTVLLLALPIWAGTQTRKDTAKFDVSQPTTIGTTQLKPGVYQLEAKESEDMLQVLHDGKLIATVPCHWTQLPKKADNSEVVTNANQVVQVEFSGRTEAVTFNR